MTRRRTSIVALLILALIAVGCGGAKNEGGRPASGETAAAPALSKVELVKQGDAACAESNRLVKTAEAGSSPRIRADEAAGFYARMIESLEKLGMPREAGGYPEFAAAGKELSEAEDAVDMRFEFGKKAILASKAGLASLEESAASALASFRSAAQEYGFEECAQGPSIPTLTAHEGRSGRG